MNHRCLIATLVFGLSCMAWINTIAAYGEDAQRGGKVSDRWSAIEPDTPYEEYEDKAEWWAELMVKLSAEFGRICQRPDREEAFQQMIDIIGNVEVSPVTKLKVCLAMPDVFLAQEYTGPVKDVPEGVQKARAQKYREIKLQMCKLQCETFLKDRNLLDSYYRALVWSRQFFGPPHFHHLSLAHHADRLPKGLKSTNPDYWWYARDFIVLVHATGQDHLLKDAKADALEEAFVKWNAWLLENYELLQGHPLDPIWIVGTLEQAEADTRPKLNEPEAPFTNWNEELPPPSSRLINSMKSFIGLDWLK